MTGCPRQDNRQDGAAVWLRGFVYYSIMTLTSLLIWWAIILLVGAIVRAFL